MSIAATKCDRSYPLVHCELVETTILPCDAEAQAAAFPAELREISASSAKLLVAGPPELPCRCRLRLVTSKLPQTFEVAAEIGWARPNPAGDWLVECEFLRRIDDRQFNVLLSSGLLERRAAVRFQTRIPVGVRWNMSEAAMPAIVRDLSEGGLCLLVQQPPRQSRQLWVVARAPQGEALVQLKVRWTLAVGPHHLIGCQFVRGEDFYMLRKLPAATEGGLSEFSRG